MRKQLAPYIPQQVLILKQIWFWQGFEFFFNKNKTKNYYTTKNLFEFQLVKLKSITLNEILLLQKLLS